MSRAENQSRLFEPLKIGNVELQNRIVMAPLTRYRASDVHVVLPIVKTYYAQRASVPGTLLISEATFISARAGGMDNIPGIYNDAQINGWKNVTAAVHARGCFIYCQLWALGRAADSRVLHREGFDYVSSSGTRMKEKLPAPKELSDQEIQEYISDYAAAATNAIAAGFDGVEIHGANGYLPDQFLQDNCNKRRDKWGGSIENRSNFHLSVAKAVVEAIGSERTGIRLSPWSVFQGMRMADPIPQFTHVVRGLKALNLAYLHLVESRISGSADSEATGKNDFAIDIWTEGSSSTPLLIAGGFKPETARKCVDQEYPDKNIAVAFGRHFISNPDIVFRIDRGIELQQYDRTTFYKAKSEDGYLDYPFSKEWQERTSKL